MSEWQVVSVIVVLVGLIISVTGPIIKLNNTITKLSADVIECQKSVKRLEETSMQSREDNKRAHKEFYEHLESIDKSITIQDCRVSRIEGNCKKEK